MNATLDSSATLIFNGYELVPVLDIINPEIKNQKQLIINGKKVWAIPGGAWLVK